MVIVYDGGSVLLPLDARLARYMCRPLVATFVENQRRSRPIDGWLRHKDGFAQCVGSHPLRQPRQVPR